MIAGKPSRCRISAIAVIALFATSALALAVDIGPMTWTPRAEWINVKSPWTTIPSLTTGATGNGTTDDTAAIEAIFNYVSVHYNYPNVTIYFPAGTYKITSTITMSQGASGLSVLGCGSNTIISWAGPVGGAMCASSDVGNSRYIGLVWEGNNTAAVAYECDPYTIYQGGIRHENESFRDINATATYSYVYDTNGDTTTTPTPPTAAIVSGYFGGSYTGETQMWNCRFYNCTEGIAQTWNKAAGNNYCWFIDSSEFDNCSTGINLGYGGANVITSCHFQNSTTADILGGGATHIRHCTSTGSAYFFSNPDSPGFLDNNVIEDCWVDSWSNPAYAFNFYWGGPNTVFDCTFTNPPSGAQSPISTIEGRAQNHLLLSNNYADGLAAGVQLVNAHAQGLLMDIVPPGLRFGALTLQSPNQTFLKTSYPAESTTIIDISQGSYRSQWTYPSGQNGFPDISAALQSAVNQAISNNNGSIVYIPTGVYNVSSPISCTGTNYTIEGDGVSSELCWWGADSSSILSINSPKITVENLRLAVLDNTIAGITATASSKATMTFDELEYNSFQIGNAGATGVVFDGPGLVLSNLPANSTVYIPLLEGPMTVKNCGSSQILTKYLAQGGTTSVSGTTAQTGFLGTVFTEGGQFIKNDYDVIVNDNQDLIFGDYYVEQDFNNLSINRGSGTVTNGRVTIGGFITSATGVAGSGSQYLVNINNYAGRLFYGSAGINNWNYAYPVSVNQAGTNPIDMIFAATIPYAGYAFTLGSSANLISTLNINGADNSAIPESPNPITATDYLSIAQSLDHFRQLEAVDLLVQDGLSTDGPSIAQYPFEGNVLDMTGKYNGTAHNVTYVTGLGSQAASFNGTSSYVQINNPITTNFSLAMWIHTTDTGGTGQWYNGHGLVDGHTGTNKNDFGTALCGGKFAFGVGNTDKTLTSTVAVNDGNWHHVVATRNSSTGTMQVYVDGVLNNSVTGPTGTKNAATVLRIGDLKTGGTGSFYKGAIDLVQIFNYALSETDVENLYYRTQSLLPLASQWSTISFDAPGGLTGDGGTNYAGAGADTGGVTSEYWNPIAQDGTSQAGLASDGVTLTGVTFTDQTPGNFNYGSPSPIPLFDPYLDGGGAANETETLNNVPAGTYNLYIYSQNGGFADCGGQFTVNGVTQNVSNDGTDHSTFINGVNYTEFTGITLTTAGSISITFQTGSHGEADLSGIQLVKTSN